jgi:hypothetical protein
VADPVENITIAVPVETTSAGEGPSGFRYTISKDEAVRFIELGAMCRVRGGDIKSIIVKTNESGVWLSGPEGSIAEFETRSGVEPYEGEVELRAELEIDAYCVYLTARERHSDKPDCFKALTSLYELTRRFRLDQDLPAPEDVRPALPPRSRTRP